MTSAANPGEPEAEAIEALVAALVRSFAYGLPASVVDEVLDLNAHREWGVALENLCDQVVEFDLIPTEIQFSQIKDAAREMGMSSDTWAGIEPPATTSGESAEEALDELLAGFPVGSLTPLGGGSTARAFRLTSAGEQYFVKFHAAPPTGLFEAERCGLRYLRGAVPAVIGVPNVLAATPYGLILEWIDDGGRASGTEAEFGTGLAQLHRATAPAFGTLPIETSYLGSVVVGSGHCRTWAEFYPEFRLRPLINQAIGMGRLPVEALRLLDSLEPHYAALAGPPEPPALLHGDLWARNRMVDVSGRNWLIDPASFWGHREYDLAMMALFGGYGPEAWDAYDEASPLADGWRNRVRWLQLEPLLVHAILFGGSYSSEVLDVLRTPGIPSIGGT